MNVQHSSRQDDWYSPVWLIKHAYEVLGNIDFDPASDMYANLNIGANAFFSEKSLEKEWLGGSLFLNPPGGKIGNQSQTALFWKKLMAHKGRPDFTHGIFLAFSAEALQNTQNKGCEALGEFPICIPSKRIRFDGHSGKNSPSHSNVIAYIPGTVDKTEKFKDVFMNVGTVLNVPEYDI